MKVLLAGDSRAYWPEQKSWVDCLLKQCNEVQFEIYTAVRNIYIFNLYLLEKYLEDKSYYDIIVIQTGWHELIESWPINILQQTIPNFDSSKCFEKVVGYKGQDEYRYIDLERLKKITEYIKTKCGKLLFIGMHSLKNGSDLRKKTVESHHKDTLWMNEVYSKFGDYFHLPQYPSWQKEHCLADGIHYNEKGSQYIANIVKKYLIENNTLVDYIKKYDKSFYVNGLKYDNLYEQSYDFGKKIAYYTNIGDNVLISKKTSIEQILIYLGCIIFGRIPCMIAHPSSKVSSVEFQNKINKIKQILNPTLCVCEEEFKDQYSIPIFKNELHDFCIEPSILKQTDTAFIQLSSGTTGLPKIIRCTHKDLVLHSSYFNELNEQSFVSSWLPLYHDMGLLACFLIPIIKNCSFSHIDPFDWITNTQILLDDIKKNNTTHVWMPNFAFELITKRCNKQDLFLTKFISCAEMSFEDSLVNFKTKFNPKCIANCYGLAENVFCATQDNELIKDTELSCGNLQDGTSILILNNNQDVTEDDKGEIYINGLYQPQILDESMPQLGYYNTGDIGFVKNGKLFIEGRKADKINNFGRTVYPYEIEKLIGEIDGVVNGRVACFGIYKEGTQKINVCVESDREIDTIIIHNKIFNTLGIILNKVEFVPREFIVKTSSGKINRAKTCEKYIKEYIEKQGT